MKEMPAVQKLYLVLSAIFLTALLIADTTAGKFFTVGSLEVSVGVIPFPITFVLTDVVNEYYGKRGANFLTAVGMAMLVFAFAIISVARLLPVSGGSPVRQEAFDNVFGMSFRFFFASLTAYVLGQLADIHIFTWYKRLTGSRHLWLRSTGSTVVSQVVDTLWVTCAALGGLRPAGEILGIAGWSYTYKIAVAVALTPLVYLAHGILTDRLGIEPAPVDDEDAKREPEATAAAEEAPAET